MAYPRARRNLGGRPGGPGRAFPGGFASFPGMPRYAIAFISPKPSLIHQVVEMDSRESALRLFFNQFVTQGYSQDSEGFSYFKEDFHDGENPLGSMLEI
jgi:hypothetical protein